MTEQLVASTENLVLKLLKENSVTFLVLLVNGNEIIKTLSPQFEKLSEVPPVHLDRSFTIADLFGNTARILIAEANSTIEEKELTLFFASAAHFLAQLAGDNMN